MTSPTVTWKIESLDHLVDDGFVNTAHWKVTASSGKRMSFIVGSLNLVRPNILIPYEDLTEELVISWVKDQLGPKEVSEYERSAVAKLNSRLSPSETSGVPWPSDAVDESILLESPEELS